MFNNISLQGILLAVQCMLIVWLFGMQPGVGRQQQPQPLLAMAKSDITKITVSDNDDNQVVLTRQDGTWLLPDYHNLPVDQGQLGQMLDKLSAARPAWPVAQTTEAAERFRVAATNYNRHLKLQSGADAVAEIYLGDSPGLRKIYVRSNDQDEIYAIDFAQHLAPATAEQWFDKNLLKPGADIARVAGADFVLIKNADDWTLQDLGEQESFDQDKVINLVNYLQFPQVQKVAPQELVDNLIQAKPVVQYNVRAGDKEISYQLFNIDEQHVLKSSLSEQYFTVAKFVADTIGGIEREALVTQIDAETEQTTDDDGKQQGDESGTQFVDEAEVTPAQ